MSVNCINLNCDDAMGEYTQNPCNRTLAGGTNAGVLFACDADISDYSDATEIEAAIAADKAWLITDASFTLEAPSPVVVTSRTGCKPDTVTTYNRTGVYYNENVSIANTALHSQINDGRSFGSLLIKECNTGLATLIDARITFAGGRILPPTDADVQRYESTYSWKSKSDPTQVTAPDLNW